MPVEKKRKRERDGSAPKSKVARTSPVGHTVKLERTPKKEAATKAEPAVKAESTVKKEPRVKPSPSPAKGELVSEDAVTVAKKTFEDLGVIESLCEACEALGYKHPTPIQTESIPIALEGRDIVGLAETGSGKTAAFALPILQDLLDKQQAFFGLVLAPTRELAYQIEKAFTALGSLINVKCVVLVGGMDMMAQSIALGKKPHIIVATPGRLLDHLENTRGFSLKALKYLVMDEADRLLDLDFGPILDKILKVLPREGRHTYLFSATMSSKVEQLQRASLHNPVKVSISKTSHQTVQTLLQYYNLVPHKHKDLYLVHMLSEALGQSAIVFTRTVNEAHRISILLRSLGISAIPLHGQLSQSARLASLNKFRSRGRDILVATDVAARGLDIENVDLVVNFDLPQDSETYVHRVGRTARAGKSGKAVTLVTQYDIETFQRIEKALGKKLPEASVEKDEVMVLSERVGEAQREAVREMKNLHEDRGKKGGMLRGKRRGGGRDAMDRDEG